MTLSADRGPSFGFKALQLISLLPRHPLETYDRIATIFEGFSDKLFTDRPIYSLIEWDVLIERLEQILGVYLRPFSSEPGFTEIDQQVRLKIAELRCSGPFRLSHNSDHSLSCLYYLLCRALKPSVVLETGVGYGASSAFILKALKTNGTGVLHSVDLPPLGRKSDDFVGFLVPAYLREYWHLHRGATKRILPRLASHLGCIDIFIHDSLHTMLNVRRELKAVEPYLADRSILVADDVNESGAFENWAKQVGTSFWAAVRGHDKQNAFALGLLYRSRDCR